MTKFTNALGAKGEQLAADYLQRLGYTLLKRNYRGNGGEIDIIAQKQGVTYFVEVKSRTHSGFTNPADSVTPRKREQISKAASAWFAKQGQETESALLIAEVYLERGQIILFEDFLG